MAARTAPYWTAKCLANCFFEGGSLVWAKNEDVPKHAPKRYFGSIGDQLEKSLAAARNDVQPADG
jgi:hypothetical protein